MVGKRWTGVLAGAAVSLLVVRPALAVSLTGLLPAEADLVHHRWYLVGSLAILLVLFVVVLAALMHALRGDDSIDRLVIPSLTDVIEASGSARSGSKLTAARLPTTMEEWQAKYQNDTGPIDPTKLGMTNLIQRPAMDESTKGGRRSPQEDSKTALFHGQPARDDDPWQQLLSKVSQDEPVSAVKVSSGLADAVHKAPPPPPKISIDPAEDKSRKPEPARPAERKARVSTDERLPDADDSDERSSSTRKIDKSALRMELQRELDRGRRERE